MIEINIKPFSVNRAWKGKQTPTNEFKAYKQSLLWQLPFHEMPKGRKMILIEFGFSSPLSDWDNCIKITQDCIATKYGFDDREIDQALISKNIVEKGKEYIKFRIVEKLCGHCWLKMSEVANCEC